MFSKYEVREDGTIYSHSRKRLLKPCVDRDGYHRVCLMTDDGKRKGMAVHRMVALTYLTDYSEELTVDHINNDKSDNSVSNLQMVTVAQNISKAHKDGIHRPSSIKRSKPLYAFKDGIGAWFPSINEAANSLGLDPRNMSQVLNGRCKHHRGYTFRFAKQNVGGK